MMNKQDSAVSRTLVCKEPKRLTWPSQLRPACSVSFGSLFVNIGVAPRLNTRCLGAYHALLEAFHPPGQLGTIL